MWSAGSRKALAPCELARELSQPVRALLEELSRSPVALGAAAAAAGAALWCCWRLRRPALDRFVQVPGLPLLGVWLKVGSVERLTDRLEEWSREYGQEGAFEVNLAGQRLVVCCRFEACEPVLAARPLKVTRPTAYHDIGLLDNLNGLLFAEGRRWGTQRRLISPAFNMRSVESYLPAMNGILDNLVARVGASAAAGEVANMSVILRCFNADVISKLAFGYDFGALHRASPELADVLTLLDGLAMRVTAPVPYWKVPGLGHLVDGAGSASERLKKKLCSILADPASAAGATLLSKLKSAAAEGEKLSHEELVGNLVILFLAGTDTSSHTLSWALYQLSRQPGLQDAVAAEVAKVPAGLPTGQNLDKLVLTRAVWQETLRLNSVTPWIDTENQEPLMLAGRRVPPGTDIWLLTREACRHAPKVKETLGADLDAFRPSRWLGADGDLVECKPFDTLTFGHGTRICVGKNLANTTGPWVLAELLRRFRIEERQGPELRERTSFVVCPAEDVQLRFSPRASA